jgi:hypothetical protein
MELSSRPLASSISALFTSISVTSRSLTDFVRGVRSARQDLAHVTRELSDLRLVLELLRDDEHDIPSALRGRLDAVVRDCGAVVRRMTGVLTESAAAAVRDRNSQEADGNGRRISWQWDGEQKAETARLSVGVQTYREAMALALEVANL